MIERQPESASREAYDLVVVGGGIYGISLVLEAARRGLRPLMVERGDFGHATSWNSLGIVHGGLRYLQTFDFRRFRESVREQLWFLRHFPDLVKPLPCLMPLYGDRLRRPEVFRWGLRINDLLSRWRNEDVREDRRLPAGEVLDAVATAARFPLVDRRGLRGAGLWYDASMPNSQRLLIEMLHWAVRCGAGALNYVEARRLLLRGDRVAGVEAVDRESGETLELRAPVVVNCAGPWCREVARRFDREVPKLFLPSLAFNALLDREPLCDAALAVAPKRSGGRTYFLVPWKGRILAGTFHAKLAGSLPGEVDPALVGAFLDDLNAAVPGLGIDSSAVLRLHWGLLPAAAEASERLAVREVVHDHAAAGGPEGLYSVSGVKFTTARRVAEKTLTRILAGQGRPLPAVRPPARPAPQPCPGVAEIEQLRRRDPAAAAAHVQRIMDSEAVIYLEDLLRRRTDWGMDPRASQALAGRLAHLMEWDPAKIAPVP